MPSATPPKVRIYELSKVLGMEHAEVIALLKSKLKITVKSHSSTIEQDVADQFVKLIKGEPKAKASTEKGLGEKAPAEKTLEKPTENPLSTASASKPVTLKSPEPLKKPESQISSPQAPSLQEAKQPEPQKAVEKAPEKTSGTAPEKQVEKPEAKAPVPPFTSSSAPPLPPAQKSMPPASNTMPTSSIPASPQGFQKPMPQALPPRQASPMPQKPGQPGRHQASGFHKPSSSPQHPHKPASQGTPPGRSPVPEVSEPVIVRITDPLTVGELAQKLRLKETEIIKHLFMKGKMITINQTLDPVFAREIATDLGFEVDAKQDKSHLEAYSSSSALDKKDAMNTERFKNLAKRPPIVSIMGHVDHGKTSLLDAIRETHHKIVDTEAGGITQSIGAYTVQKNDETIVFLDTPGHEAFTAMRMRGAKATDIAILVVAADDGVMPQTIEAINHAKAANIPMIIAVNKIDKAGADPDRVLSQLSDHGLISEKWGGDTVSVEVSALQRLGIEDLLEMILLVAEILDLKADATVPAQGVIVEAKLDKQKGPVADALVLNGTLKVGDLLLMGPVGGKVRALINDDGERVQQAGPALPVEILGLSDVPKSGDMFEVLENEKVFKQRLSAEKLRDRESRLAQRTRTPGVSGWRASIDLLKESNASEAAGPQSLNLIVKADNQGSLEAVSDSLLSLSTDEVQVKIIHSGTGSISEADVMLAAASEALIVGFNVKEDSNAYGIAEQQGVTVKTYDVIYHLSEDIENILLGKLAPESREVEMGQAEVRQLFTVGKNVVIAGCMVLKGKMLRNAKAVVMRGNQELYTGNLDNLKRFKDDAKEVAAGYECGISFDGFNDLVVGDVITVYTTELLEQTDLKAIQQRSSSR